jgi:hypothetical protein
MNAFDIFMILFIIFFAITGAVISKKIFKFFIQKDFPLDNVKSKLNEKGYLLEKYEKINEKSIPQNVKFDSHIFSFAKFPFTSYYKIIALNKGKNSREVIFFKYDNSISLFNSDKYNFVVA